MSEVSKSSPETSPTGPGTPEPGDAASADPLVGRTIGRFSIVGKLGAGGMGAVYVAEDETLGRRVALKAIHHDRSLDFELRLRFQREARALSQLDHPHVCRIYDYFEADGGDYLVLELIEGQTLDRWAAGRPRRELLTAARDIADALGAAHECGIVHRDLKPGNVMVATGDTAKVLDFGLAAQAAPAQGPSDASANAPSALAGQSGSWSGDALVTEEGVISGTPRYMSPEQALGQSLTTAADVYSLGLILQELLTGRPAFKAGLSPVATWELAKEAQTEPLDERDGELRGLVERMLARAPSDRPTARDVVAALEGILGRARRRLLLAGAAMAVLVTVGGVAKYVVDLGVQRNRAIAASDEADRRRGQAEELIGFMLGDLRDELAELNSLAVLDSAAAEVEKYFGQIPEELMSAEERIRRSQLLYQLGDLRLTRGNLAEAGDLFEASLAVVEPLAQSAPEDLDRLMALGAGQYYVGYGLMEAGELDAALAHFGGYLATAERGLELSEGAHEWQLEVGWAATAVGALCLRRDDFAAAAEEFDLALEVFRSMYDDAPSDPAAMLELADILSWSGFALLKLERDGEAETALREEHQLRLALSTAAPDAASSESRLATCETYLGEVALKRGRNSEALEYLSAAFDRYERLWAEDPENLAWRRDRAMLIGHRSLAHLALDQRGEARELHAAALAEFDALVAIDPDNGDWTSSRDVLRTRFGEALERAPQED